jgi:hypothetical protein
LVRLRQLAALHQVVLSSTTGARTVETVRRWLPGRQLLQEKEVWLDQIVD